MKRFTHDPSVFDVTSMDAARQIILTPEDSTTDARWETETPYLVSLLQSVDVLWSRSVVLDYGCGIGRMAKLLIDRFGCTVVGIEPSTAMATLAMRYVGSKRFSVARVYEAQQPFADSAIAVWVLQHCPNVADDVARIVRALKPGGHLFVVNQHHRSIPTVESGWVDDGIDVFALLGSTLTFVTGGPLAPARTTERVAAVSAWAVYRRD